MTELYIDNDNKIPSPSRHSAMSEGEPNNNNTTTEGEMTVLKVYELAADVGKECQLLIERFGQESASNLTLKIISILEHLETLVNMKAEFEKKVAKLSEDVVVIESELTRKTEENVHLQVELQKVEGKHYEDLAEWKQLIDKARRENHELKRKLNEKEGEVVQEKVQEQETLKVLLKLKETVDRQRDQIRAKNTELLSRNLDVEALQQQVERLAKVNSDLRRKHEVVESHSKRLIRQNSHLQVDVIALNKNLHAQKSIAEVDETDAAEVEKPAQEEADVNTKDEDKMVIDLRDPDRPRFTIHELRKVLQERDEMHLKVLALEDELESYRPQEEPAEQPSTPTPTTTTSPDRGAGKNKPSGIRKFFTNLFGGSKQKSDDDSDVTEELKKWEFLDFDQECVPAPDGDQRRKSFNMGDVASSKGGFVGGKDARQRKHSDITPSRSNNNQVPMSGRNENWFGGARSKSSTALMESLELTEKPRSASEGSQPVTSSAPRAESPRSRGNSNLSSSSDKTASSDGESSPRQNGGGSKEAVPFNMYGSSVITVGDYLC